MEINISYDQYFVLANHEWDTCHSFHCDNKELMEVLNPSQLIMCFNAQIPPNIAADDVAKSIYSGDDFEEVFNVVAGFKS